MTGAQLLLLASVAAGAGLGALYLGALWWAVRRLPRMRNGALWLVASAWVRIGLLLAAFYLVSDGRWERLLACLLGFAAVRLAATRLAARTGQ